MFYARRTDPEALTLSDCIHRQLDKPHDEEPTWQERLYRSYFEFAMGGVYTYAALLVKALTRGAPSERKIAVAAGVLETTEPLDFHSGLRAYMDEEGRLPMLAARLTRYAIEGKAYFAKLVDKLASLKPPTLKEATGKILVVDGYGGETVMSVEELDELQEAEAHIKLLEADIKKQPKKTAEQFWAELDAITEPETPLPCSAGEGPGVGERMPTSQIRSNPTESTLGPRPSKPPLRSLPHFAPLARKRTPEPSRATISHE